MVSEASERCQQVTEVLERLFGETWQAMERLAGVEVDTDPDGSLQDSAEQVVPYFIELVRVTGEVCRFMRELEGMLKEDPDLLRRDEDDALPPRTMSVDDFAQLRGVTTRTVRNWRADDLLKGAGRGRVRVSRGETALLRLLRLVYVYREAQLPADRWTYLGAVKELASVYDVDELCYRLSGPTEKDAPSRRTIARWIGGQCAPQGELGRRVKALFLETFLYSENGKQGAEMSNG